MAGWKQTIAPISTVDSFLETLLFPIFLFTSPVQFSSVTQLCPTLWTPWIAARQASLSITIPEFTQTHVHWVSDAIQPSILCYPLLLLPLIPPSIRIFSNESTLCMRLPKYWSFSFSISPSNEHSGLISFRMDWLDNIMQIWDSMNLNKILIYKIKSKPVTLSLENLEVLFWVTSMFNILEFSFVLKIEERMA